MDMFCSTKKKEYFESEEFLSLSKDKQNEILRDEMNKILNMTRYGLVWEEHPEQIDLKDLHLTVLKDKALSLPMIPNKPINYLIEGDNYHVLKVLQKTHKGKVNVIYIDPPYNTGNEFVYNDKLVDKEDMFSHSKWLSFMSKRLKLARELLSNDGVIFVSIDDNEQAQLKLLMDKVFGEENFIADLLRKTRSSISDNINGVNIQHENTLVYGKDITKTQLRGELKDFKGYKNPDNDENGDWIPDNPSAASGGANSRFPITNPYTKEAYYPPAGRYWSFNQDTFKRWVEIGKVVFPKEKGKRFTLKKHKKDLKSIYKLRNSLDFVDNRYLNSVGTKELRSMGLNGFNYPKPTVFIKELLKSINKKDTIVLDFFAGSGTTGHAVMELNKEDGGDRKFILCTNNEVSEEKEREYLAEKGYIEKPHKRLYNNFKKEQPEQYEAFLNSEDYQSLGIARSVTRERLKRVIEGYTTPKGKKVEGLPNNLAYLQTSTFTDEDIIDEPEYNIERLQMIHELKYPVTHYETIYVSPYENKESITNIQPKTDLPLLLVMDTEDNYLISRASEIAKEHFSQFQQIIRITDYL